MSPQELCPISREYVNTEQIQNRDARSFDCPNCGKFIMGWRTAQDIEGRPNEERVKVRSVLKERELLGNETPLVTSRRDFSVQETSCLVWEDLILAFPTTVADRLNRTLLNLGKMSNPPGKPLQIGDLRTFAFAEDHNAAVLIRDQLFNKGLITYSADKVIVTVNGWNRIAEIQSSQANRNSQQAFVAMSFSLKSFESVAKGLESGIVAANYKPLIIKKLEHNDKICDRIIAEIRKSRFLVADFTDHRQSVYFEAGFALGIGIPVIWTCRKDQINEAHFDTRQYNHIDWETPGELAQRLEQRVRAIIV